MRKFYDIDHDRIWTEDELRKEHKRVLAEDFTDEEYQFWLEVRNHWAEINGKQVKEYTKDQMVKWYNKLHTDSAEYKMWGNGIGLPNALYMMEGIEEALRGDNE